MALTNVPYRRQTDAQALEIRAFHTTALLVPPNAIALVWIRREWSYLL